MSIRSIGTSHDLHIKTNSDTMELIQHSRQKRLCVSDMTSGDLTRLTETSSNQANNALTTKAQGDYLKESGGVISLIKCGRPHGREMEILRSPKPARR